MIERDQLDLQHARDEVQAQGWTVLRGAVPPERVAAALRLLNLEVRRSGLTPEQIREGQLGTFFPHLRWEPEVWGVLPDPAAELLGWQEGDDWGEPQILLRFPDEVQDWPREPHVDQLPSWAQDKRYLGVVGVALTSAGADDGVAWVWPGSHLGPVETAPVPVPLQAGDALVMHPQLGHTGTLNLGHTVRTAVYFRLLTPA